MARHPEQRHWSIKDLAKRTATPAAFLAKIFQTLVKCGILNSTKGRAGGFSFTRPVNRIFIMEIVESIDGSTLANECALGLATCSDESPCPFHAQWDKIRNTIIHALSTQSLEQFAQQEGKPN
jgi:Rrf2 family protein